MAEKDAPATQSSGGFAKAYGLMLAVSLAISGLIGAGLLPVSCGKRLPFVGQRYRQYCDECGGDGNVTQSCRACRGRGYYGGVTCSTCQGKGRLESTCPYCAGSGKKPLK